MKHLLILPFIFLFLPQETNGQANQKNPNDSYLQSTGDTGTDLIAHEVTTMEKDGFASDVK